MGKVLTWAHRIGSIAAVILFGLVQWANYDHLHNVPYEYWDEINGWTTIIVMSLIVPFFGYIFFGLIGVCIDQFLTNRAKQ